MLGMDPVLAEESILCISLVPLYGMPHMAGLARGIVPALLVDEHLT